MHVTLVPDLPSFGSMSMSRYYRELKAALLRNVDPADLIDEVSFPERIKQVAHAQNRHLRRWIVRFDRWLVYPQLLRKYKADVFHILDHSHAHLASSLQASRSVVTCHDLI